MLYGGGGQFKVGAVSFTQAPDGHARQTAHHHLQPGPMARRCVGACRPPRCADAEPRSPCRHRRGVVPARVRPGDGVYPESLLVHDRMVPARSRTPDDAPHAQPGPRRDQRPPGAAQQWIHRVVGWQERPCTGPTGVRGPLRRLLSAGSGGLCPLGRHAAPRKPRWRPVVAWRTRRRQLLQLLQGQARSAGRRAVVRRRLGDGPRRDSTSCAPTRAMRRCACSCLSAIPTRRIASRSPGTR